MGDDFLKHIIKQQTKNQTNSSNSRALNTRTPIAYKPAKVNNQVLYFIAQNISSSPKK